MPPLSRLQKIGIVLNLLAFSLCFIATVLQALVGNLPMMFVNLALAGLNLYFYFVVSRPPGRL